MSIEVHATISELFERAGQLAVLDKIRDGEHVLVEARLLSDQGGVDESGFEAISNTEGGVAIYNEVDPTQPYNYGNLVGRDNLATISKGRWEFMKDRKELTIDILQVRGDIGGAQG